MRGEWVDGGELGFKIGRSDKVSHGINERSGAGQKSGAEREIGFDIQRLPKPAAIRHQQHSTSSMGEIVSQNNEGFRHDLCFKWLL
jgi:hypothetical protein